MSCRPVLDHLAASLDGPLAPHDQAHVDGHLAGCPSCVRALKDLVMTAQVLRGEAPPEETGRVPALPATLVQRILAARAAEAGRTNGHRHTG